MREGGSQVEVERGSKRSGRSGRGCGASRRQREVVCGQVLLEDNGCKEGRRGEWRAEKGGEQDMWLERRQGKGTLRAVGGQRER